ncbi:hypothetical protein QTI66_31865 [Variovorax sp. J22R133]|uniref:hypothetical protein n=1 Tax=Variovorax brevis TaxID=3053503 RepID=UPI002575617C|nr:hypothetical protein [Variovorax sp. J22R133]MDM0116735.1 hypothetical protein [Variovorax sp. J22R133]
MAVELCIDDGIPWYLSPNIWVVPSDDPNDPAGMPFADTSAYVWARVRNRGTTPVMNASVRFYWADPSTVITPTTATLIGASAVSLAPAESKDVLCVTPWIPQFVNSGHECLLAQSFAPSDPAPAQGANDPFNVASDRHTAQRNISVGAGAARMMIIHPFVIANDKRFRADHVVVRVKRAELGLLKGLQRSLGFDRLPQEANDVKDFGLQVYRCGQETEDIGQHEVKVLVAPGQHQGLALVIRRPEQFADGTAALFLIEQHSNGNPIGGLGFLAVPEWPRKTK